MKIYLKIYDKFDAVKFIECIFLIPNGYNGLQNIKIIVYYNRIFSPVLLYTYYLLHCCIIEKWLVLGHTWCYWLKNIYIKWNATEDILCV